MLFVEEIRSFMDIRRNNYVESLVFIKMNNTRFICYQMIDNLIVIIIG